MIIAIFLMGFVAIGSTVFAQSTKQPNILFIMGDDIGFSNISAYSLGVMEYQTPKYRSHWQRRCYFYRFLCRTKL